MLSLVMRYFDAHCDTIQPIVRRQADFTADPGTADPSTADPGLHVTLPGMLEAGLSAQVFAAWVYAERGTGTEYERAMEQVKGVEDLCRMHSPHLMFATGYADIAAAAETPGRISAIASLEGADPLMGDVDTLRDFYAAGVRLVTLAWGDNAFSGTVFGDGTGLTAKGRELVELCNEMGVVVDVSHASDLAFSQVADAARGPFVASHSNCRTLCPHTRNLTDEMIRSLGQRGGVMGVNLASSFLSADFFAGQRDEHEEWVRRISAGEGSFREATEAARASARTLSRPPLELVVTHVRHAMNVGGEDCVGLGGDLDGIESTPAGMDTVADYAKLEGLLLAGGLSRNQVEKVCHENFERVFREVLR
jgi:membrane dipeptidase